MLLKSSNKTNKKWIKAKKHNIAGYPAFYDATTSIEYY